MTLTTCKTCNLIIISNADGKTSRHGSIEKGECK